MAGDARAFAGDGFFGDLNQDFLPLLEQLADDGQTGGLHVGAAATLAATGLAATAASAAGEAAIFATGRNAGAGRSLSTGFNRRRFALFLASFGFFEFLFVGFGEACFRLVGLVGLLILVGFGRGSVAEPLLDVNVAQSVADGGGLVEGLLFKLIGQVFLGLAGDRLEVVLVLVDGLFFQHAHAGRVSEELADDFAFRGSGFGLGECRWFGGLGQRRSRWFQLMAGERAGMLGFFFLFFYGGETEFAARRFDAMRC